MAASSPASAHGQRRGRQASGLVEGPEAAEEWVAKRVVEGVDYVKIVIDLPGFDQSTVDALATAARRRGLRTIAHVSSLSAVRMAQVAGVSVLAHAPLDRAVEEVDVARAAFEKRVIIPTLTMMEAISDRLVHAARSRPSYEAARASVAALHRAGVPVLAGTGANKATGVPAWPPFGESLHHELELLVDAGLSTVSALHAATALPAVHFGLNDRGTITPGARVDLLLVAGDPVADIKATRLVERVWCAGVEHRWST
ncbi:hypothetical protein GCM10011609_35030 [Lentzea pudingi]|uniref:Amidohydrolase-related domain-containing protein n=1 Tax=Lentzea pudingi TaxID=1789439 RepID=A0ABQ2HZT8_9PSEU|nr:hypothetical protein GCM10011609_35030 [Lentzea pudingi]